jgi:hypothetical protein
MLVSRKIAEFKRCSQEETEGTLIGKGLATQGLLRKLKAGESFIDCNGQRWWKSRNKGIISVYGNGWSKPLTSVYGNGLIEISTIYGNGNE